MLNFVDAISYISENPNIYLIPTDTYDVLKFYVVGIKDTPYEGGFFKFTVITDNNNYPFIRCDTLVWHPNIDPMMPKTKTNICNHIINVNNWDPEKNSLKDVVKMLKGLIHMEKPYYIGCDHPLNDELTPKNFEHKAKEWTVKFASQRD